MLKIILAILAVVLGIVLVVALFHSFAATTQAQMNTMQHMVPLAYSVAR